MSETPLQRQRRITRAQRINDILNADQREYTMMDLRVMSNQRIASLHRKFCTVVVDDEYSDDSIVLIDTEAELPDLALIDDEDRG
jgi:hypothetical protein